MMPDQQLFPESADSPPLSPVLAARMVELRAATNIRDVRLLVRGARHAILIITPVGAEIPSIGSLDELERLLASMSALSEDCDGHRGDWGQPGAPYLVGIDLLELVGADGTHRRN